MTAVFDMDQAKQALERQSPQIAVLDVNISGELSFPVADLLDARNIPIARWTAAERDSMPCSCA